MESALGAGLLDLEITHVGDFSDRERARKIGDGGGYSIFIRSESQ
jgi:hypothetical protein